CPRALCGPTSIPGRDYRFLIVGEGSEQDWLKQNMLRADLPGVLRGEALANAYASMDAFVFPSRTDTFGNLVLEAMACGTVPVVASEGGPKYIVRHGVDGYVAEGGEEFAQAIATLAENEALRARIQQQARRTAERMSWDAVFERVYEGYRVCLPA